MVISRILFLLTYGTNQTEYEHILSQHGLGDSVHYVSTSTAWTDPDRDLSRMPANRPAFQAIPQVWEADPVSDG